jgi:regulatory factor X
MLSQEPGAPYPAPRTLRPSGATHPLAEQTQMMPMDHEMARMLQAENAREMSQTPMDIQMHHNKQIQPHPHQHQHQQQHHHQQQQQQHMHQQQQQQQQQHHQQQPQHFMPQDAQAVYFGAPQPMQFNPQQMDYAHAQMQQQQHMIVTAMPQLEPEARKPRQSAGPNENELKDMLSRNLARSLDELAAEVRANEKTSSAEKSKQLFAMLW